MALRPFFRDQRARGLHPRRIGVSVRCRTLSGWLAGLLCLASLYVPAAIAATANPLADAQAMLARLTPSAPTSEYSKVAREFGNVVDSVRQTVSPDLMLEELRKVAHQMREHTQERLRTAEAEAGDSEAALEQIYKSATWDDLSFALAAFPYWQAWLDLTLAERPSQAAHRDKRLWEAKRGFRAASMQIFQPNLVYGGWLGMAYIAKAEGSPARALQILEALKKALATDPNHPVYKVADAEMRVLHGEAPPPQPVAAGGGGSDAQTEALRAEAAMLLEKHRQTEVGARDAAERIRRIIDSNHMTMAILGDVLSYQKEIAREDLGVYTDLVLAEFNFNNQQWYTAVQKYQTFFQHEPRTPGMNFDRFHYRLAIAYFKNEMYDDAAREAEKLLRAGVADDVKRAATKLAYVARANRQDNRTTSAGQAALATAAKRFIAQSPSDPDADGARLILAQQSGESGAALRYLDSVKSTAQFKGGVEATRYYLLAKDFAKAARTGSGLELLAQQALSAWEDLPSDQKKTPENQAFMWQLRAVVDPKPEELLKRMEIEEQKAAAAGGGQTVLRAYLWARLKLYERLGQPERLLADIQAQGANPVEAWRLEQYYPFVHRLTDRDLRIRIAEALEGQLKTQPEMERRFRLMRIEDLIDGGRGEDAYTEAKRLVKDYPRAGDGYRVLAKAAQQTKRAVEADNAWRIITDKVPPKEPVWWEGMLSRIEIRHGSTRPEAACELAATVDKRLPVAPDDYKSRYAALRPQLGCAGATL